MTIPAQIDHVVITVHAALDAAAETYRRLGFQLTERGHHTLGSSNHLAIFGTDYLELLGYEPARAAEPPPGLAARPVGFAGVALKPPPGVAVDAALAAAGIASEPSREFSRPVEIAEGNRDAAFRVTQVAPEETPFGQVFFCHHFTPELVWRPEWQAHPNRVTGIAELVIAATDPAAAVAPLAKMFGATAVQPTFGGFAIAAAGGATLLCLIWEAAAGRFGGAVPTGAAGAALVGLVLRSADLAATRAVLAAGGVPVREGLDGRILVGPDAACGVALAFAG